MSIRPLQIPGTLVAGAVMPQAGAGVGASFGTRNPCRGPAQQVQVKGAPTAEQLKPAVAKRRPFQMLTGARLDIDPSQAVYPVRGGFVQSTCTPPGKIGGDPGANCLKYDHRLEFQHQRQRRSSAWQALTT